MNYADIINKSVSLFSDRGAQYGEVNYNMERACLIYNTITGERMTPYQANMFLHSLKLARIRSDWKKGDNYFDGINYLAFAGEAAQVKDDVPVPAEEVIAGATGQIDLGGIVERGSGKKVSPKFADDTDSEK